MLFSPLTPDQFAQHLPALRPALLHSAARKRVCCLDDAEDLVAETVRMALLLLPEFKPETGIEGLRRWLYGILSCVVMQDRQRAGRQPQTVPIEAAGTVVEEATAPPCAEALLETDLAALALYQRVIVCDWLDGYTQTEIARRKRLHRNTVGTRLELAFEALRRHTPDSQALSYSGSLFAYCSQITIYHKPKGVWRSWRQQHPADVRVLSLERGRRWRSARATAKYPGTTGKAPVEGRR